MKLMPGDKATMRDLERQILERSTKDSAFRAELVANPKEVLAREINKLFPGTPPMASGINIKVVEQTDDTLYLVLPKVPKTASRELKDEELAAVTGGCTCLIPIFSISIFFNTA